MVITGLVYVVIYVPPYILHDRTGGENLIPLITNGMTYHWYNVDPVPFYLISHARLTAIASGLERSVSGWIVLWIVAGLIFDYLMLCKSRAIMNQVKLFDTSLRSSSILIVDLITTLAAMVIFWSLSISIDQMAFLLYHSQPNLFHTNTRLLFVEKAFPNLALNDIKVIWKLMSNQVAHPLMPQTYNPGAPLMFLPDNNISDLPAGLRVRGQDWFTTKMGNLDVLILGVQCGVLPFTCVFVSALLTTIWTAVTCIILLVGRTIVTLSSTLKKAAVAADADPKLLLGRVISPAIAIWVIGLFVGTPIALLRNGLF